MNRPPIPGTAADDAVVPPTLAPPTLAAVHTEPGLGLDEPEPAVKVPLKIEDWLTVVVMGLLVAITFTNVVVRYLTNESFAWTEEFSIFLMIVLAMVAGSAAVARGRHIRIEYFAERGSARRQRLLARFGAQAVFVFFLLLAVLSVRLVVDDIRYGETSPGIGVPQWWYSIWLPICSLGMSLRALGVYLRAGRDSVASTQTAAGGGNGASAGTGNDVGAGTGNDASAGTDSAKPR